MRIADCVVKSFAASNTHMTAVHDLIPGGAHTYAKGDDQYPDGWRRSSSAEQAAGSGILTATSTLSSVVDCVRTSGTWV